MSIARHIIELPDHDLPIDEELELHKKGWQFQRIGWVMIILLMILAALGLFGDGVLSRASLSSASTKVEFERFFRHEAPMPLKLDISKPDTNVWVSFPAGYLKRFRVESILPAPETVSTENGLVRYRFAGSPPANIIFYLVPQETGSAKGSVTVNGETFQLSHFIYP